MRQVRHNGRFKGPRVWYHSYGQAIGTLALAECLARLPAPDERLETAVRRAVGYIERTRTRYGWRYANGETDTSVTGWMVLALKSAEHAGVPVRSDSFDGVRDFLEEVSRRNGTTGYMIGMRHRTTAAMTATGLFLRIMLGESPTTPRNRKAARRVEQMELDIQNGGIANFYDLYYAALALYQVGGDLWQRFNPRIRDALVAAQRRGNGCEAGSWPGASYVSEPVLATCFATLILETYYRYLPVHEGLESEQPEAPDQRSPGERQLEVAGLALEDLRARQDGGAILAAEAAYERVLQLLPAFAGEPTPAEQQALERRLAAAQTLIEEELPGLKELEERREAEDLQRGQGRRGPAR